jgi:hypothetical protein
MTRRLLRRYRRVLAALAAGASVAFTVLAVRPEPPPQARPEHHQTTDRGLLPGNRPDLVAVPVRIADAGVTKLLHRGDRVDVYATVQDRSGFGAGSTRIAARSVPVLAIPPPASDAEGALLLLQTRREEADALAASPADARFSIVILGNSGG